MPEVCGQKSTAEMSVARQGLAETYFRGNEYTCINQRVAQRLSHISWQQRITQESTIRLGVLYSVFMKLVQFEIQTAKTESSRELRMKDSIVEVFSTND
jgi:hypothetical protein